MTILGIGGILHDAAAAILVDGDLAAAVEQNKVARRTRPGHLPDEAISACQRIAGVRDDQIDCVAVVRPIAAGPESAVHLELRSRFPHSQIVVVDHHRAHAASAYYPSPFENAIVLTLDRSGDFRCGARWIAEGTSLVPDRELYYPDSLGELYTRVTSLLGFEPNAEEHKVQWLSASGDNRMVGVFTDILGLNSTDWPRFDRTYFHGERMTAGGFSSEFYERLGLPDGSEIPQAMRASIAAGVQRATEKAVLAMAGSGENLCLGGGVSTNALLVAALENSPQWKNVFVQPAGSNAGTAIGAVFHAWHSIFRQKKRGSLGNFCLGPAFDAEEIKQVLENCKLHFRYLLTIEELIDRAVEEIQDQNIVAWMHGRMEFGPRALGNRSILASPLNPYSTENLNLFIKHREPFRKFAASVPAELASEYFEVGTNARFLASVGRVHTAHRKTFESAIMGPGYVRVQTVTQHDNPLYWRLLHAAGKQTGLPVLYNTSFNLFGDPLVCTPRDAVRSFYSSGIDSMFVGHFLLKK
ncbi:MAG TPA: carbamoyltransferase C-terminal domain-containing protein [Bryobacteraceae bacterium]|nr:carbamoyltransferase C-terminal domain-containing protein [Bryobacteraceae bacterium]